MEQEYFSDAISEDIITEMSKISRLMVIALNLIFIYKRKSTVPSQGIGCQLFEIKGRHRRFPCFQVGTTSPKNCNRPFPIWLKKSSGRPPSAVNLFQLPAGLREWRRRAVQLGGDPCTDPLSDPGCWKTHTGFNRLHQCVQVYFGA
jgi:hypothetical protein